MSDEIILERRGGEILEKFEKEINDMIYIWTKLLDSGTIDQLHDQEVRGRLSELKVILCVLNRIKKEYGV